MRSYLANDVRVGSTVLRVGKLVDDAVVSASQLVAAGAVLIPETQEVAAAANLVEAKRKALGLSEEEASALFLSTVIAAGSGAAFSAFANRSPTLGAATLEGNRLLAAGSFTSVTGTPQLVTDSVRGGNAFRFSDGDSLVLPAGKGDFTSQQDWTLVMAVRWRKYNRGATPGWLLDGTANGTRKGFQLAFFDNNIDIFANRVIAARVFDGATWVLDTPADEKWGHWKPLKTSVVSMRITQTYVDIRVDGRGVLYVPRSVSFTWPGAAPGPLSLLGAGQCDVFSVEGFKKVLSDADLERVEKVHAAGASADMLVQINGLVNTGTPPLPQPQFVGFPWVTKLPDNRISVTSYCGPNESPQTSVFVTEQFSADGLTFTSPVTIYQGVSGTSYADPHTLVMSNGLPLRIEYTYDNAGNGKHVLQAVSADQGSTYPALTEIATGLTFVWIGIGGSPVEDPANPGHIHVPVYLLANAPDSGTKVYDLQNTNYGQGAWTAVLVADGVADAGAGYAEAAFLFHSSGEMRVLIRDTAAGGIHGMKQARSLSSGAPLSWSAVSGTVIDALSAAQGYMEVTLPDSTTIEVWPGGRPSAMQQAVLYYRAHGAAYNDPWQAIPDSMFLDPRPGASAYGGAIMFGGRLYAVWGEETGSGPTQVSDVTGQFIDPWLIVRKMPGSASPASATVIAGHTLQLSNLRGAGNFVLGVSPAPSGGSITQAGLYTAGLTDTVTDEITIDDCNGNRVATIPISVVADPAVTVATVFPDAGSSAGGTVLEVTGTNFVSGQTTVMVGGVDVTASIVFTDAKHLTVVAPALAEVVGGYAVQVTAPNGTATKSGAYTALHSSLHRLFDPGVTYARTITSGKIAQLSNVLGTGDDVLQLSAANQPTLASGINGKPTVHQVPGTGLVAGTVAWASTQITLAILFQTSDPGDQALIGQQYNAQHGALFVESATGKLAYITADNTRAKSDTVVNDGLPHAGVGTWTSADNTARVYLDGVTAGATTAVSVAAVNWNDNGDRNAVGTFAASQNADIFLGFRGDWGVAAEFTAALTGTSLAVVVDWLKRRGGIA